MLQSFRRLAMEDGTAPRCYTEDAGLSAMHFTAEARSLITVTTIKNCFVKCDFSIDDVSTNGSAVKLSEDEEDDRHNLQPRGVQFEDCATCDGALEVCGNQSLQSIDQV
jgi:hypothetical protein